jgi:CHAD domain-containing protein
MNKLRITQVVDRFYDNMELILHNIVPGFEVETIHNFRLSYKNLRAFIGMLGEQQGGGLKIKTSRNLRKTYNLLGNIRNLNLQQVRISQHQHPKYPPLRQYVTMLGDEISRQKLKLLKVLSKEPLRKSKSDVVACLPGDFSIVNFQIYVQLKLAAIISIVESSYIRDKSIHMIRKELDDLYNNRKKYEEIKLGVSLAPILEGKDDKYFLKLLEELGAYHDICTSIRMIKKSCIKDLISAERETIKAIRKSWLKENRVMKDALVKKLKKDILSINTYKEYNTEPSGVA